MPRVLLQNLSDGKTWLGDAPRAADPHVSPDRFPEGTTPVDFSAEELQAADAVVLLVNHDEFDTELIVTHSAHVLDTKALLPAAPNVERL